MSYIEGLPLSREDEFLQQARDAFQDGQIWKAAEFCSRLIEGAPDRAEPYYRRARCWQRLGQTESAKADFTRAIELLPEHQEYVLSRSLHLAHTGDLAGALEDLSRWVVRLQPVFEKPELFENLLSLFRDAASARPDDPDLLLGQGLLQYLRGRYESAVDSFTASIRLHPSQGTAIVCRALAFLRLGDYERASSDLAHSLLARPNWAPVHHAQGLLHHARGEMHSARSEFTRAIQLDPAYYSAYRKRGILLHTAQDYPGAARDFTKAAEGMGDSPDLIRRRGWSYLAGGDPVRALADFNRCLVLVHRTRPGRAHLVARLLADRGLAHLKQDHFDLALADLEQALQLHPAQPEPIFLRGLAMFLAGRNDEAEEDCREAADATPAGTACHHAALGLLHRLEGSTERAGTELREAARLYFEARNGELHQRMLELVP